MIRALNAAIEQYKKEGEYSEVDKRRFNVLYGLFLNENPKTRKEVADTEHVSEMQVSRDVNDAVRSLTEIILGVGAFVDLAKETV